MRLIACIVTVFACAADAGPRLFASAQPDGLFPNGRILELDPNTGAILNTIESSTLTPTGDFYTGLTYADSRGTMFINDGYQGTLFVEFDIDTGAVINTFPSPLSSQTINGEAFGNGVLYGARQANGAIYVIDPDTGATSGPLPNIPGVGSGGLAMRNGRMFSAGASNTEVREIDPADGLTLNTFGTPNGDHLTGLAFDGFDLYICTWGGLIHVVDPATGTLLRTLTIGIPMDGLAVTNGSGCSEADVTTQGASQGDPSYGFPDGQVTAADLNYFVNAWVDGDAAIADVTTQGAPEGDPLYGVPDGIVSGADLNYFVNIWIQSCP